ncbi:MAG: protein translocase subunit SecD [bacterium]
MILWTKSAFILVILALCLVAMVLTYQAYRPDSDPAKFTTKLNLGLDLQGGMYLDLEVDTQAAVTRVLDRLAVGLEDALLDNHLDYETVERRGEGVEVTLPPGVKVNWNKDPFDRLLTSFELSQQEGNRFKITMPPGEVKRIRKNAATQALEVLRNRIDSLGVSEPSIQRKGEREIIVQLPGVKDRESALKAIGNQAILEFYLVVPNVTPDTMDPARHTIKYQEIRDEVTKRIIDRRPYVLQKLAVLSGETVSDARVQFGDFNRPYVGLSFDSIGTDLFGKITSKNRGRNLAIVLDGKVKSAPVIQDAITGGEAQITGGFTLQEATDLTIWLRSGALPAPLSIREERTVGASLGEDSIRQGITSLAVGGVLVMLFMIFYYRLPGGFAAFALVFNLLIILSVLAFFSATLTLPGIAGIVLTMGMSVDANVLIFERIREELGQAGFVRVETSRLLDRLASDIRDALNSMGGEAPAQSGSVDAEENQSGVERDPSRSGWFGSIVKPDTVSVERLEGFVEVVLPPGEKINWEEHPFAGILTGYKVKQKGRERYLISVGHEKLEGIRKNPPRGKNIRDAINEGFKRAIGTIFDSNITTLAAALALLFFGTGPIKGFAVTLSIGIGASMFTAIFVTRFLFELLYLRKQRIEELSI